MGLALETAEFVGPVAPQELRRTRVDRSGANAVHPDIILGVLKRRRAAEVDDAGLGRVIRRHTVIAAEAGHGRGVDDSALGLLSHNGQAVFHAQKGPGQRDGNRPIPAFQGHVLKPGQLPESGIIEHDIKPAIGIQRKLKRGPDAVRVSHIHFYHGRLSARVIDLGRDRLGPFPAQIRDNHRRPFLGKADCRRRADPGTTRSDNRHLSVKFSCHSYAPLTFLFG